MKNKRIVYFDYLRSAAVFSVIVTHVAGQNWFAVGPRSLQWNIFNFYDCILRWGVPSLLMISGSLFLSSEKDMKSVLKKNVMRMVIAYCFWSVAYAMFFPLNNAFFLSGSSITVKSVILDFISGHYHLWFLPMIAGIYICLPVIRQIALNEKTAKYFLVLSFIFSFVIPQLLNMADHLIGGSVSSLTGRIRILYSNMNLSLLMGYVFYFILGYVMNKTELSKKQRNIIYLLGFLGAIATAAINSAVSWKLDYQCDKYLEYFNFTIVFEALAVHTFFKYRHYKYNKLNSLISKLANYSFGIYLVHVFSINILELLGINTLTFAPIISVPFVSLVAFIISLLLSGVINKVPLLNKWVV